LEGSVLPFLPESPRTKEKYKILDRRIMKTEEYVLQIAESYDHDYIEVELLQREDGSYVCVDLKKED